MSRFAAFSTREQIEQVLGYCNRKIQWLLVKLSFDCGRSLTAGSRLISATGMIVFEVRKPNGGAYESEARERLTQWIVNPA